MMQPGPIKRSRRGEILRSTKKKKKKKKRDETGGEP